MTTAGDGTFTVVGSHTYAEEASKLAVTVTIQDTGGASATAQSTANVADAAVTGFAATITAVEGAAFSGAVATFSDADPNGAAADYTATITWNDGSKSSGTITPLATGGFNVVGSHTFAEEGSNLGFTVAIADAGGSKATVSGTATVSDAPLTGTAATIAPSEGTAFSGMLATFTDADPNGAVADYTATIQWGDGTSSSPGTITTAGDGTFTVSASHTYAEEASDLTLAVTIRDAGGAAATAPSTLNVADAALTAKGLTIAPVEGAAFAGTLATFTDADPNGAVADYTATIAWGDGSAASPGTVTTAGDGTFTVVGSHTYAEEASKLAVTVTIQDTGGASATAQRRATSPTRL